MDEFWAIVFGAVLATVGGIIGTWVTDFFEKRKEKKSKKTEAYIKILSFLHTVKYTKSSEKEVSFQLVAEVTTLGKLYGSKEVQNYFDMVLSAIANMYNLDWKSENFKSKLDEVDSLINLITAQMKKEIGLSDENS